MKNLDFNEIQKLTLFMYEKLGEYTSENVMITANVVEALCALISVIVKEHGNNHEALMEFLKDRIMFYYENLEEENE